MAAPHEKIWRGGTFTIAATGNSHKLPAEEQSIVEQNQGD
jgi:hypothetical protein